MGGVTATIRTPGFGSGYPRPRPSGPLASPLPPRFLSHAVRCAVRRLPPLALGLTVLLEAGSLL